MSTHSMNRMPALLVGHHKVLQKTGGGMQACNREYVAALEAAGFDLHTVSYDSAKSLTTRIRKRLVPEVALHLEPPGLYHSIQRELQDSDARFVFFSSDIYSGLSQRLAHESPQARQILLSFGIESIDVLIAQRIRRQKGDRNRFRALAEWLFARQLLEETERRRWIDAVLTLSPFEAEMEKWLGSSRVLWVRRMVAERELEFQPMDNRVGCVSTLDHPPNLWGLINLFEELEKRTANNLRFRLVGQPASQGASLAKRYDFVEYLGPLTDAELRSEAATWCCFVHPIFEYARGCSTKLAICLGWGLPIATTEYGVRGYVWDQRVVPVAQSAAELADLAIERSTTEQFDYHRKSVDRIRKMAPGISTIGDEIRSFLLS